jgi:predicted metalloprotease with PDZ domain
MSLRAPFVDAASSIDPANDAIFTSYYPYGAVIALALDLSLRQQDGAKSLDDVMRLLWRSHGVTEKPFLIDDLRTALAQIGGSGFAGSFFERSIHASELPDFAPLLAQAGLTLRPRRPDKAYLGAAGVEEKNGLLVIAGYPEPGSALYAAGISAGDQLLSAGARKLRTARDWEGVVGGMKPGTPITLTVRSLGQTRTVAVMPAADRAVEVVRDETIGKTPTAAQLAFRRAWLGAEGTMIPSKPVPKS